MKQENLLETSIGLCIVFYVERPAHITKHPKWSDGHYASTFEIRNTILHNCSQQIEEHREDEPALQVQRQVYSCIDFVAAEAWYHTACYTGFSARKQAQEIEARKTGRKRNNEEMILLFKQTCMWLENDISIHSVQAFRRKIIEICKEEDIDKVYNAWYIKNFRKTDLVISFGPVKIPEKRVSSTLKIWQNILEKVK